MRLIEPLRVFWPDVNRRRQLVREYVQLGQMKSLLADIALRGRVFTAGDAHKGLYEAGVAEGRRQIALELIRTAGLDPAVLQKACTEPVPDPRREPGRLTHQEE